MHRSVLLKEAIEALEVEKDGLYIDATVGEGGHLEEMLRRGGRVLGIDADEGQVKRLTLNLKQNANLKIVVGNFANIEKIAKENDFFPVDGVIFDLGLSMTQIQNSGKGLSYRNKDETLDMRLDRDTGETAEHLINSFSEDELYEIFSKFSEEINSRSIAGAIVRARKVKRLVTVGDLVNVIDEVIGGKVLKVYSRIFQALRMAVNDEINNLKKGISGAETLLKNRGRIAVITFHSVEDRIVKQFGGKLIAKGDRTLKFERSAKLRLILKQ